MKSIYTFIFLIVAAVALRAQTATITASYSGSVSATYKTVGDIDSVGDSFNRGYVKFDLSSLPSFAVVTSATLQYYNYTGTGSNLNNSIYALSSDPATTSPSALYTDCGNAAPMSLKLAYLAWTNTTPFLYSTALNATALTYINSRVGSWVGMGFTRDAGGTIIYSFRGYTNTSNPPKLVLNYFIPSACSGAPSPGTVLANFTKPCTGDTVELSLNGTSVATGLTFQWQRAAVGGSSWSVISGANSNTYRFSAATSYDFRCVVTCSNSLKDSSTAPISINVGGINTYPYNENFEATDGGWKGVDLGSGINEWIWGAPSKTIITGAVNGSKCWSTNLLNNYSDLADNALESPCLDLTYVTLPRLAFSMRYITEVNYDGLFLETSVNGGSTWTKVPQANILSNTYNSNSTIAAFTPPAWCGDNVSWLRYLVVLPNLGGISNAKVRIHFQSDQLVNEEGVSFDSVSIVNAFYDLAISKLVSPVNACSFSGSTPVQIILTNKGLTLTAGTKIPVAYQMNNGTVYSDVITLSINKAIGDTIQYQFSNNVSITSFGNYNFKLWADLAVDGDHSNDTLIQLVSVLSISSFPYNENFETSNGGWFGVDLGGGFNQWVWGTPAKLNINGAANGSKCWITNLVNDYTDLSDYGLESPCLDFSNTALPRMAFSMRYRTEVDYDGVFLETSTNGGATWTKVPQANILTNTYNNTSTTGAFNPPAWSGDNGSWLRYLVSLPMLGNISTAKIRVHFQSDYISADEGVAFDSVVITNTLNDITLANIISPVNSCSFPGTTPLKISILNVGLTQAAGTKIPVSYSMNGGTIRTDTIVLQSNKAIGDTIQFSFTVPVTLAGFGAYNFKIWCALGTDADRNNDTLLKTISIVSVTAFPYRENFEANDGGWISKVITGTANDFYWGTPAKTFISGAASGNNCWVTKFISSYEDNSDFVLESPCLNLTNSFAPFLNFSLKYKTDNGYDGSILESSINGGITWNKVTTFVTGDYNTLTNFGALPPPFWSGTSAGWVRVKVSLSSFTGQSNVKFRLHFKSDNSDVDEGVAFDSVSISDVFSKDVGVSAFTEPVGGCGLTASMPLTIVIKNFGKQLSPGTKIPVSFKLIDLNSIVVSAGSDTVTLTSTLNYRDSILFTFTSKLNLLTPGYYFISSSTDLVNDSDATNNSIANLPIISRPSINTYPFYENFELSDGNFYGEALYGNPFNEWGWNFPVKPVINSTPNGQQCWLSSPFGNYGNDGHSALYSACFDFGALTNPELSFLMRFKMQINNDAMVLESSINGGYSWQRVDTLNSQSLYNNISNLGGIRPPKWSGDNGSWKTYKVNLFSLHGQSNVQFRFRFQSDATVNDEGAAIDSFIVYDNKFKDLSMLSISSPISKCGLSTSEMVSCTFRNMGNIILPVNTVIPISYAINNGLPVDEQITLTTPLAPGATFNYNFTKVANLSAPGTYNFKVYVAFPNDINYNNDTIDNYIISAKAIVGNFPYHEDFENSAKDWTVTSSTNEKWQVSNALTNPTLPANFGSYMGVFNASTYSDFATSRFISPCFDFTTLNNHGTLSFFMTFNNAVATKKDSLNVLISTTDGATWDKLISLSRYNINYTSAQWGRIDLDISAFAAQPKVLIAFEAIGRQGNNFAIDDIHVYNTELRSTPGIYSAAVPCPVIGGSQWIDLRDDNNDLIAQINPNGNNLGKLCFGENLVTNKLRFEKVGSFPSKFDYFYFARNIWMQSSTPQTTPVSIRIYYQPSEYNLLKDSVFGRTGVNINKTDLSVLNYYNSVSPDDLDVLNNNYTTGTASFIAPTDKIVNSFNYFEFNAAHLGELNLLYRKASTGIAKSQQQQSFQVYPNPASSELILQTTALNVEGTSFEIYDAMGKLVLQNKITGNTTSINITSLSEGVYLIKYGYGVARFVKK